MHFWDAWFALKTWVLGNKVAFALLTTAAIKVAPVPGQPFKPYQFLYDWAHQYLNIPNLRLTPGPVITPPTTAPENEADNKPASPQDFHKP